MANIFSRSLPVTRVKHSVFDLSRDYKTSFNIGELIPVFLEEVLPGDKFRIGSDVMIRLAPLVAPIMERLDVRLDYFFVPDRLCFNACGLSFEDFITGGSDGTVEVPMPFFNAGDRFVDEFSLPNTLPDYLGIQPHETAEGSEDYYSALPFLAYHLVADNFYMDQTFDEPVVKNILVSSSGKISVQAAESPLLYLRNRCYAKDYFTTAMPTPQRGDSVYLISPFAGSFTPEGSIEIDPFFHNHDIEGSHVSTTGILKSALSPNETITVNPDYSPSGFQLAGDVSRRATQLEVVGETNFCTDAPTGTFTGIEGNVELDPVTVNDFFTLQSLQRWLNHNNNYGGRYIEQLAGHFGVISSDARLQIPQYLGGGKAPIQISEVLQTAQNTESGETSGLGVGDFAGHGLGYGRTASMSHYFNEHGIIIGILSVVPKNSYASGAPKIFFKKDRFDFAFPEFANIGEQEIKNKEIFISGDSDVDDLTFGYTPRYAEYRVGNSLVTGDFRSSLNYWHLARSFEDTPSLNLDFLKVSGSEMNRIFQVPDSDVQHIWCDVYHNVTAVRPLPVLPNTSLL